MEADGQPRRLVCLVRGPRQWSWDVHWEWAVSSLGIPYTILSWGQLDSTAALNVVVDWGEWWQGRINAEYLPTTYIAVDPWGLDGRHVTNIRMLRPRCIYTACRPDIDLPHTVRSMPNSAEWPPDVKRVPWADRDIKVGFVGSPSSVRVALKQTSPPDWRFVLTTTPVREAMMLYGRSRIVFNENRHNDTNVRNFEALAAGAVLVTGPSVDADLGLMDSVNCFIYSDVREAYDTLRRVASLPSGRLRDVAMEGYRLWQQRHQTRTRLHQILVDHDLL